MALSIESSNKSRCSSLRKLYGGSTSRFLKKVVSSNEKEIPLVLSFDGIIIEYFREILICDLAIYAQFDIGGHALLHEVSDVLAEQKYLSG